MSANYEHDQDRLANAAAHVTQTAIAAGVQLWMARQKPLKVQVKTATQDVQEARKRIDQGTSKQEVLESILKGEVRERVTKAGGDPEKYAQIILQRAEIERAVETMPKKAPAPTKAPKKVL
jgi:hypothetical protein